MTCFSDYHLGRLPKGSSCVEPKQVPARSSYWKSDTDSVERCNKYSTDGDSDRSAPDREPAPPVDDDDDSDGDLWPRGSNGYERVDPTVDDHGETVAQWDFETTARQGDVTLYVIHREDSVGGDYQLKIQGEQVHKRGHTSSDDPEDVSDSARNFMIEHDPDVKFPAFERDVPNSVLKPAIDVLRRTEGGGTFGDGGMVKARKNEAGNHELVMISGHTFGATVVRLSGEGNWGPVAPPTAGSTSFETLWDSAGGSKKSETANIAIKNPSGDRYALRYQVPGGGQSTATLRHHADYRGPRQHEIRDNFGGTQPNIKTTGKELKRMIDAVKVISESDDDTAIVHMEDGEAMVVAENDAGERAKATFQEADVTSGTATVATNLGTLRDLAIPIPKPASTRVMLSVVDGSGLELVYEIEDHANVRRVVSGDDEIPDYDLSSPPEALREPVSSSDGPLAQEGDLPGQAFESLRKAWQGLEIAVRAGDRQDAKQYGCVINGIRAGHGMEPLKFKRLNGFKCAPSGMGQPESTCPRSGYDLAEPIQSGTQVPESVAERLDFSGDSVVWTFPKAEGCRCGSQALQLDTLAREQGVNVYGVAAAEPEELKEMGERLSLGYTLISDPEGELADHFGVEMDDDGHLQRHLFYVRDGQITDVSRGMTHMSQPGECPLSNHTILGQSDESTLFESLDHPGVYVATGKRNSGKSSLAMRIGERFTDDYDIKAVTVGMPVPARDHFPDGWLHVESISDAPPNSVVVVDEAYAQFHSRDAMSDENKDVGTMVNTSRHCQQTYVFVSQNARYLDVGAVSEADGLLMKEPGTFHMEFERPQIRDLSETAKDAFEQLPADLTSQAYTYVYTDEFQGMVQNEEASFYDDQISRSYSASCEL